MNALLQKLLKEEQDEKEFHELERQIREAAEANPEIWTQELDRAAEHAHGREGEARAEWERTEEEVKAREDFYIEALHKHFEDAETKYYRALIETKAAAYDAYWDYKELSDVLDLILDLRMNIYAMLETQAPKNNVEKQIINLLGDELNKLAADDTPF